MNHHPASEETAASDALSSPLKRLSARRVAFFARHEGFFLRAISIPLFLCAAALLVFFVLWVAGQGGVLEEILTRRWVF